VSPVGFSGSYDPGDVTFLLKVVALGITGVAEKEALIQSGSRHYSEMIGPEHDASPAYLAAFDDALAANGDRLARDVLSLAALIDASRPEGPLWLVSLARAGTPVGALLGRCLRARFARDARHVSVSIIAGRGVDARALDHLRGPLGALDDAVVFVDGWTGKGVIAGELARAVADYNGSRGASLDPTLHVVADLCGVTPAAATTDDYVIPSCLLGATVSGLVSRSILNADVVGDGDFHACRFYDELRPDDRSRAFLDDLAARVARVAVPSPPPPRDLAAERARATAALDACRSAYGVSSASFVKPGIGEATRVLLRRVPRRLVVRDRGDPQVRATVTLAAEKRVPVDEDPALPWAALALIEERR
jgi:hypothetical protein